VSSRRSFLPGTRFLRGRGRGRTAVVAAVALTAGAFAFPASAGVTAGGPGAGSWRTVPGPAVPAAHSANLTALAMAGPSVGWAAGFTLSNTVQNAPFEPLLSSWNGHRWSTVRVSIGAGAGRLDGLAARSATDAWAVGTVYSHRGGGTGQPLTEHWNGRRWARVPAPGAAGWPYSMLNGVAAGSADDVWAVGEAAKPGATRPLAEHWNGRRWQMTPVPGVGPDVALSGVAVAANGQAWAVGSAFKNSRRPLVLHWSGHAWAAAAVPQASGDVLLSGVTAVSLDDAWAVGSMSVGGKPYRPFAMRWNGRRWAVVSVPDPGPASANRDFFSVASVGHGRLVAVGDDNGPTVGGALYGSWNGHAWSVSLGPLSPKTVELNAVAYDGQRAVWAVGSVTLTQQTSAPVVQVNR
jgi:hypothetical protein